MAIYILVLLIALINYLLASKLVYINGTVILEDVTVSKTINIETYVIGPLKIWHIGGMVITLIMSIVITWCCCNDVRIPRTKQEIENNYNRRKLHAKIEDRMFSFNSEGYKTYIDQFKCQKVIPSKPESIKTIVKKHTVKVPPQLMVGETSKEVLSNWKAVSASLKTISEEAQSNNYTMTGTKHDMDLRRQRPSQKITATALNSIFKE